MIRTAVDQSPEASVVGCLVPYAPVSASWVVTLTGEPATGAPALVSVPRIVTVLAVAARAGAEIVSFALPESAIALPGDVISPAVSSVTVEASAIAVTRVARPVQVKPISPVLSV